MQGDNRQPDVGVEDIDTAADTTSPSVGDVTVSDESWREAFSRVSDEKDRITEELAELKKNARTSKILDDLIEPTAKKAFWYMFIYSGGVGLILLMNAFGCFQNPVHPDVLKFLVGSTAATVIGLVGMVLTGVFVGARK